MKNIQIFKKQSGKKGFALTEVLLAIAVIVIIGISVYPIYLSSKSNADVQNVVNTVTQIGLNTDRLYSRQTTYTGISMSVLRDAGMLPDTITDTTNFTNIWGGTYSISVGVASNNVYWITVTNIPKAECTKYVTMINSRATRIGTSVGDASVKEMIPLGGTGKIDQAGLISACNTSPANISFVITARV